MGGGGGGGGKRWYFAALGFERYFAFVADFEFGPAISAVLPSDSLTSYSQLSRHVRPLDDITSATDDITSAVRHSRRHSTAPSQLLPHFDCRSVLAPQHFGSVLSAISQAT